MPRGEADELDTPRSSASQRALPSDPQILGEVEEVQSWPGSGVGWAGLFDSPEAAVRTQGHWCTLQLESLRTLRSLRQRWVTREVPGMHAQTRGHPSRCPGCPASLTMLLVLADGQEGSCWTKETAGRCLNVKLTQLPSRDYDPTPYNSVIKKLKRTLMSCSHTKKLGLSWRYMKRARL